MPLIINAKIKKRILHEIIMVHSATLIKSNKRIQKLEKIAINDQVRFNKTYHEYTEFKYLISPKSLTLSFL